jgi:hypothetical protein
MMMMMGYYAEFSDPSDNWVKQRPEEMIMWARVQELEENSEKPQGRDMHK